MRLLLIFFLISSAFASETKLSFADIVDRYGTSEIVSSLFTNTDFVWSSNPAQSALAALKPSPKAFTADYGNGVLTQKLELATLELLSYKWVSNIVTTFSNEICTGKPEKKARILVETNNKTVRFQYLF